MTPNISIYSPARQFFLFIGLAVLVFVVFNFLAFYTLPAISGLDAQKALSASVSGDDIPKFKIFLRGYMVAQFLGLFLLPSILFAFSTQSKPYSFLQLRKIKFPLIVLFGILLLISANGFAELLGVVNAHIHISPSVDSWIKNSFEQNNKTIMLLMSNNTMSNLLLNLFFLAVFAGVGEELFFRGVLQNIFINWTKNVWAGIIIAALAFTIMHWEFMGFFPRFYLGILLGTLYYYTKNIWYPIIAHFSFDAFQLILAYYNPEILAEDLTKQNLNWNVVLNGVVSLIIGIAILLMVKRYMQKREPVEVSEQTIVVENNNSSS